MKIIKIFTTILITLLFLNFSFASLNRKNAIAERFMKKAHALLKKKSYFRARRYFERAARKFSAAKNVAGLFKAYKGIGDVNMRQGYLDRAFDNYNRAKYFAFQARLTYTMMFVDLCRNVAYVHESHRYYRNAAMFMKIVVNIGGRIGDPQHANNVRYLNKLLVLSKKYGNAGH